MEGPRSVRVLLFNDEELTFPNAVYDVDYRTRWLIVYRLVEEEREQVAQFDLDTVRYHEYFIEE